jgi:hypothetical protein
MKTNHDPLNDLRFRTLIVRLQNQAVPEPAADFAARTLARLRHMPGWRRPVAFQLRRVAAGLALLGCGLGVWWLLKLPGAPGTEAASPAAILMRFQQPNGSWPATGHSDPSRYDVAVTALALLALMNAEMPPADPSAAAAIRNGMEFLLRHQRDDGHFGQDFSSADFTHYLAAMAVKMAAALPDADPVWTMAFVRAAVHLPPRTHMAKLNHMLAHAEALPPRWADAGGPAAHAALQMLTR